MSINFSIIVPSFNQADFLEENLQSIIGQDYENKEIIVIDGGSSDKSTEVLRKYDDQIDYWISEPDKGTFDANNKAMRLMTGDYWCIINSDDVMAPDALKLVAEVIEVTGEKWVTGGVDLIDKNSKIRQSVQVKLPKYKTGGLRLATNNSIYHPSTYIHCSIIDEVGYFHSTDIMDYEYWLRMEDSGYTPFVIDDVLSRLRFHDDCKSWDYLKMYKYNSDLLRSFASKISHPNNQELIERSSQWMKDFLIGSYKKSVAEKDLRSVLEYSWMLAIKHPTELTKRWYWGVMSRFFKGLSHKEYHPYHFMMDED